MIKPTVGRVVWYTSGVVDIHREDKAQPFAAIVAYVWNDRLVNLTVFDHNGRSIPRPQVQLLQEGDARPQGLHKAGYCEWMPYQKGQAAKAEAAEAAAAKVRLPPVIPQL